LEPEESTPDADDPDQAEQIAPRDNAAADAVNADAAIPVPEVVEFAASALRSELLLIRDLLTV
jgi:hypothetical protein